MRLFAGTCLPTNNVTFFLLPIFLLFSNSVFSQNKPNSPYRLDVRLEVPVMAVGTGFSALGISREPSIVFRNEEPDGITVKQLLGLERPLPGNMPTRAKATSDWLTRGTLLLPFALMLDLNMRNDAGKLAVLYSETLLLSNGMTMFSRGFLGGTYTAADVPEVPIFEDLMPRGQLTFFSGHTAIASSLSFCTAKIWSDYHPDSHWRPFVWTTAVAIPAATGYFQYRDGNHSKRELASGFVMGALTGYLIPHLHKVDQKSKTKVRVSSTMVGSTPLFVVRGLF